MRNVHHKGMDAFFRYCKEHGISGAALGRYMKVHRTTANRILKGEIEPTREMIRQICLITRGKVTPNEVIPVPTQEEIDRFWQGQAGKNNHAPSLKGAAS